MTGIVTLVVLTAVNILGVKTGARVQNVFTVLKVAALLGLVAPAHVRRARPRAAANRRRFCSDAPFSAARLAAVGVAMVGSLFSADAWNNVGFAAEEVKDAGRNVGRAMGLGTALVCLLYIVANLSYLCVLPIRRNGGRADPIGRGITYAAEDRVATAAAEAIFGGRG